MNMSLRSLKMDMLSLADACAHPLVVVVVVDDDNDDGAMN